MRFSTILAGALICGALAAPLAAQDTTKPKPKGAAKVAHDVGKATKKAAKDTKAEAKRDASKVDKSVKAAAKDTKDEVKKVTGKKPKHAAKDTVKVP